MHAMRIADYRLWVLTLTLALGAPVAEAQEEAGGDDVTFEFGGSCGALAYVSPAALRALVKSGHPDDFHSFCYPEDPSECSDYTASLRGLGRLSTGEDGYHCSLQLQI